MDGEADKVGGAQLPVSDTTGEAASGDFIDRAWGGTGPTGLLVGLFVATAVLFGGAMYAVTAYGPSEIEPATVLRQYSSSSTGSRSVCGIEVEVASGQRGKAAGGGLCAVYEKGEQAAALVSTITGDVVGVRHAGQDLGRSGNPLAGFAPVAALLTAATALVAARRNQEPPFVKLAGVVLGGAVVGLAVYWLWF